MQRHVVEGDDCEDDAGVAWDEVVGLVGRVEDGEGKEERKGGASTY